MVASESDANKNELIFKLSAYAAEHLSAVEAELVCEFSKHYINSAYTEDLLNRDLSDLFGIIYSHWKTLNTRGEKTSYIEVYNPQFESHGWQSNCTVIEISHEAMPFLVDSLRIEISRRDLGLHTFLNIGQLKLKKDKNGKITEILAADYEGEDCIVENPIFIEVDKQIYTEVIVDIKHGLEELSLSVENVVSDWHPILNTLDSVIEKCEAFSCYKDNRYLEEIEFLSWLKSNHFTFLAYNYLDFKECKEGTNTVPRDDGGLGLFKKDTMLAGFDYRKITNDCKSKVLDNYVLLLIAKHKLISNIHHSSSIDLVLIKEFDENNNFIGMHQFAGLYTSLAYSTIVERVPLMRIEAEKLLQSKAYQEGSHEAKNALHVVNNLPRNDLFQFNAKQLEEYLDAIRNIEHKQEIRALVRKDLFGYYYSCMVFVPREKFGTDLRLKIQKILISYFQGKDLSFSVNFSELHLNRIDFIVSVEPNPDFVVDLEYLNKQLLEAGRTWYEEFAELVVEHFGAERGNEVLQKYSSSFNSSYKESFTPKNAIFDISYLEKLDSRNKLSISFYRELTEKNNTIHLKLFNCGELIPLSDIIPMLEHMGFMVISQNLFQIKALNSSIWLNSFTLSYKLENTFAVDEVKENFLEILYSLLMHQNENDKFNSLVLSAGLNAKQINMLRAYAKYMWQIGFPFSQTYIEKTLNNNPNLSAKLVSIFETKFSPELFENCDTDNIVSRIDGFNDEINNGLEHVVSLDEDRIIRKYKELILATVRTNYYQIDASGKYKSYLSYKLAPSLIEDLPQPKMLYEIFVYSTKVEGVHLRGGKVARGGLRWSDRKEDYRTEILGLVKAQLVKNAVIVPSGAKGGFIIRRNMQNATREEIKEEAESCYKTFISGLLDLTDNIVKNEVVHPVNTVIHDDDDPYLVVAADKGTATFSDIANEISKEYNFWLNDAFASGGSQGYDHKKMGITARGAWESVKRSFSELGHDTQTEDFTVVGVGDMSGDVFGNGMLLSEHIRLTAAFNHMHIFIDPSPDAKSSFEERKRLFEMPRSAWSDYNPDLISKGGGVFSRSSKYIKLSAEIKERFDINRDTLTPNELIKMLLRAEVDLLFNGGIGTYVKASSEHDTDIGDRANDSLRVNGKDLKCKVIGEGGNLGFSQLGRIEYALSGGKVYTDAIDNSAGVDCSDHEVNIKILLDSLVEQGDLTLKQRNILLADMTEDVAKLVLKDNVDQTLAISMAEEQSHDNIRLHNRIIEDLSKQGKLNIELEKLPDSETLLDREKTNHGLTRPELSVLISYSKILLKNELVEADLFDDEHIASFITKEFPERLQQSYLPQIMQHNLKKEIIATKISNTAINEMSFSFIHRLCEETLANTSDIIKCYLIAREVFNVEDLFNEIDALALSVDSETKYRMLHEISRLLRRATRWLLRFAAGGININNLIDIFGEKVDTVMNFLPSVAKGATKEMLDESINSLTDKQVPEQLAVKIAGMPWILSALDITDLANLYDCGIELVANVYYSLGNKLKLGWLRSEVKKHSVKSHWDAIARASIRDDIDLHHRNLTIGILLEMKNLSTGEVDIDIDDYLLEDNPVLKRWYQITSEIKSSPSADFIMYSVAIRELFNLTQLIFEKK